MLDKILRGSDWKELGSYLSPAFFETVSPFGIAARIGELTRSYVSRKGFDEACTAAESLIQDAGLPIVLQREEPPRGDQLQPSTFTAQSRGDAVLELYFRQLLTLDTALLDLRHARFRENGDRLEWRPSALLVRWDPVFLKRVRAMYDGFYLSRGAQFDDALADLGLASGRDVLLTHFGDNQHAVRFRLSEFRATFHQLFTRAKAEKARIPSEFFAFGAGLVCLYEHLEQLDLPFDVRGAYLRARRDILS